MGNHRWTQMDTDAHRWLSADYGSGLSEFHTANPLNLLRESVDSYLCLSIRVHL